MYLFAATSYGHAYPVSDPNDPVWQRPTIFRALNAAGITWRYYCQDDSVFLANWADWNDPQIQGNVRNISEYYNILASPSADQDLPGSGVHRAGRQHGVRRASGQQRTRRRGAGAADFDGAADQRGVAGFGVHPDVGRRRRMVRSRGTGAGHAAGRCVCRSICSGHTQGLFNVTGFRVPMVVVSPWVKPHTVSHLPTDYTAMLKLIETRFDAPALTQRDATADDMADPTNGLFDFSTPHLLQVPAPALPTRPMARVTRHWRARRIRHGEGRAAVGWVGRVDGSLQRCCGAKGKASANCNLRRPCLLDKNNARRAPRWDVTAFSSWRLSSWPSS